MDLYEQCLHIDKLQDPDDLDALLKLADLTRRMIHNSQHEDIGRLIQYTIDKAYFEAFSWIMAILEESCGRGGCVARSFSCKLGRSINGYDEFLRRLQVDLHAMSNEVEKEYDENGEVCAFNNICIYKTGFEGIFLITAEEFDTKDNDRIEYSLRIGETI